MHTSTFAAMPRLARAFGSRAFSNGSAFCTDGYAGTALWLPPGVHPDEEGLGAVVESTVAPSLATEVAAVFEQMAKYHPTEPHWHLPLIGAIQVGSSPTLVPMLRRPR